MESPPRGAQRPLGAPLAATRFETTTSDNHCIFTVYREHRGLPRGTPEKRPRGLSRNATKQNHCIYGCASAAHRKLEQNRCIYTVSRELVSKVEWPSGGGRFEDRPRRPTLITAYLQWILTCLSPHAVNMQSPWHWGRLTRVQGDRSKRTFAGGSPWAADFARFRPNNLSKRSNTPMGRWPGELVVVSNN